MVESSHDAVNAGPPPVSSENESNIERNDNTFDDNATATASFSVFLIQSVCSPPPQARFPSPPRGGSSSPLGTHISISSQEVPNKRH
ncbi:putative erythroid differentiation-related factor 1 isoform [Sesbania bispinosa]|nr:putative erythroid differentiation-related factor 1 isoform [Sesbania bispinosa]